MAAVKSFAEHVSRDVSQFFNGRLHCMINNAGVFLEDKEVTVDGLEMTWAVNVAAPFLLTAELLPLIVERIINISSISVDSFNHLVSLERLNLQMNQLEMLLPGVFNGYRLLGLKSLDLGFNRVWNISGVFVGLDSLESLSLFDNRLIEIGKGAFEQMPQLKRLDLGNCSQ